MKKIKLTQGKWTLVDNADYEWLNQWGWYFLGSRSKIGYAVRCVQSNGRKKSILMHRTILGITDPKIHSDHKNCNSLDNRRENLRECTPSQNQANRKLHGRRTSKYRGVCRQDSKWLAQISEKNVTKKLGFFAQETEAAKAYDKRAMEIHGEFARLNFPDQTIQEERRVG